MPVVKQKQNRLKHLDDESFYESPPITDFPSKYHPWFVELGYPQLDMREYQDGSWILVEYLSSLAAPRPLFKWRMILGYFLNEIPTKGIIEKYIKRLDTKRREFWDLQEKKTKEVEDEHARSQKHKEDMVARAHKSIVQNPDLMERIAKNGLQEMDIDNVGKHMPRNAIMYPKFKGTKVSTIEEGKPPHVSFTSQSTDENVSSGPSKTV